LAAAYSGLAAPVTSNDDDGTSGVKEQSSGDNSLGFQIPNPDVFLGSSGTAILMWFYCLLIIFLQLCYQI
jgi:hypothetical protein